MCIAFFGCVWRVVCYLVGMVFQGIAWGMEWLYSITWFLMFHAFGTYVGFFVTFALSRYWRVHMGSDIDSENLSPLGCQCHCLVAPAPHPTIHHLGAFISIWHNYHGVILQTIYYLAIMVLGAAEICLVWNRGSDRLARVREALGNLGQLKKSLIEITVLRLIVFLGDVFCDPSEVDLQLFLTFVFAYLNFASVLKLIDMGEDFGWLDGLVSVILTAFEHFVRPWSFLQLLGIVLTTIVVCYKNTMWSGQGKKLQPEGTREEVRGLIEMTRQHQHEVA